MAHPATRVQTQRSRQGQRAQQRLQEQGQQTQEQEAGQGVAPTQLASIRSFHDAAWHFNEFEQSGLSTSEQDQAQNKAQNLRSVALMARGGLRRGRGDFEGSNTQRNPSAMAPPANPTSTMLQDTSMDTKNYEQQQQQRLGFSQAFALGVSIPTSEFNTEAFGTLSVRPAFNSNSNTNTGVTGSNMITVTAPGTNCDPVESLDDDLELPGDFDELFEDVEMDVSKEGHGLGHDTAMSQAAPIFGDVNPPASQNGVERVEDSQAADELASLRQRLAEMETQLRTKEEELQIKTGQASILKEKLDEEARAHTDLKETFRTTDAQHQSEKAALEEKHRMDLSNAKMSLEFEVHAFLRSFFQADGILLVCRTY
ncbi:hypothetical protein BC939DRAFT_146970 [Gamsiella multidivaricata]|uniref:uncharacterized protein n=1 Tax=Gamsiella multidivaricata TaxID=101098 RepID=UPI0022206D45|nr:uncharacterized protein BC939DRAFT_146970 [Gamsiella multidivaricata]KAI7831676.1 hypothetical protein BC939DRAFT_146970 [Gamsiella multidivaricata]